MEAKVAERRLELNELKIARLKNELMPVVWVHQFLAMAGAELRKPIEIIGRHNPELQKLKLTGLDNSSDQVSAMFADDHVA